jgi:hypothetical protein
MTVAVAVVQVLTALGLLGFWVRWFRQTHAEPWQPVGHVEYERVFVWPDSVAAVLLLISGAGALAGWSGAAVTSYVAAGMLLFLAIIDTAYYLQHKLLRLENGGAENLAILVTTTVVAFTSITHHVLNR